MKLRSKPTRSRWRLLPLAAGLIAVLLGANAPQANVANQPFVQPVSVDMAGPTIGCLPCLIEDIGNHGAYSGYSALPEIYRVLEEGGIPGLQEELAAEAAELGYAEAPLDVDAIDVETLSAALLTDDVQAAAGQAAPWQQLRTAARTPYMDKLKNALPRGYGINEAEFDHCTRIKPDDGTMLNQYSKRNTLLLQPIDNVVVYPKLAGDDVQKAYALMDSAADVLPKVEEANEAGRDFSFNGDVLLKGVEFLSDHVPMLADIGEDMTLLTYNALAYYNFENQVWSLGESTADWIGSVRTPSGRTGDPAVPGLLATNLNELAFRLQRTADQWRAAGVVLSGAGNDALTQQAVAAVSDEDLAKFFTHYRKEYKRLQGVKNPPDENEHRADLLAAKEVQSQLKKMWTYGLPKLELENQGIDGIAHQWSDRVRFGKFVDRVVKKYKPDVLTVQEGNFQVAAELLKNCLGSGEGADGYDPVGQAHCKVDNGEVPDCAAVFVRRSSSWKPVTKLVAGGSGSAPAKLVDVQMPEAGPVGLAVGPGVGAKDAGTLRAKLETVIGGRDLGGVNNGKPMALGTLIQTEGDDAGKLMFAVSVHSEKKVTGDVIGALVGAGTSGSAAGFLKTQVDAALPTAWVNGEEISVTSQTVFAAGDYNGVFT